MQAIALTPLWIEEQRELGAANAPSTEGDAIPAGVVETLDRIRNTIEVSSDFIASEFIDWSQSNCDTEASVLTGALELVLDHIDLVKRYGTTDARLARQFVARAEATVDRLVELVRAVLVSRPDVVLPLSPRAERRVFTVRVSPVAYLRAMWNLFWSAIRHPFSETTIDLSTGRVLYRS